MIVDKELQRSLRFGSEKHTKICEAIRRRKDKAEEAREQKRTDWEKVDENMLMYKKPSRGDTAAKNQKDNKGNPDYETIVVPYSYGIMMTAHTYLSTVFLSRSPTFQVESMHEHRGDSTQAMESFLDYQTRVGKNQVKYFTWLFDYLRYGEGIIGTFWDKQLVTQSAMEEQDEVIDGIVTGRKTQSRKTSTHTKYEGNSVYNVHPIDFLPDPRVSIANFQAGEFCARKTTISWSEVHAGMLAGRFFNTKRALKAAQSKREKSQEEVTPNQYLPDTTEEIETSPLDIEAETGSSHLSAVEMYVKLIPSKWGLSDSDSLEVWVFTLAEDSVLIEAESLGMLHGDFPFDVLTFEFDQYTLFSRGLMEMSRPMNDALTWLLNSHMFNVRKILNNELIYDPSRLSEEDLTKPKAGRLVRLKPTAYGTDPRLGVHQLQVTDVTRSHLEGMKILSDLMKQVFGVNDNLMGLVTPGGRKTATEVRTSSTMSANRLQTHAEFGSAQGFYPHVEKLIANTQQFFTGELKIKVAGNMHAPIQQQYITLTPDMIAGKYEYIPIDGTMPIDRFAQANLYKELLMAVQQVPQIAGRYDVARIFGFALQLAGVRNLRNFELAPQERIQQQAQAGNLVPVGQ